MVPSRLFDPNARWPAAGAAAVVWAVVAGSVVLWWLHMPRPAPIPQTPASLGQTPGDTQARGGVERALGHTRTVAATPDVQKRFVLLGVIAAPSGQGSALLAVDGQPARAFTKGQNVTDGWRLDSVSTTSVRIAPLSGGPWLELALPQPRPSN